MSSSGNRNEDGDGPGSSQRDLDEHYRLMEEEIQLEEEMAGGEEGDDDAHDGGDERGNEITDSGATGGGSETITEAKRQRKKR